MTLHMSEAASRAESKVGLSTPHGESGWCLEWCVQNVYGIPGPWKFAGNGRAWAYNYWLAAKKYGKVVQTSDPSRIPRGAMTFSKGASKYGHVFIATGDARACGTDYPRNRRIGGFKITDLLVGWRHQLLGYIEITGDGQDLRNPGVIDPLEPSNYYLGAKGPHVLWLGERLVAHGYKRSPIAYKPTDTFTKADLSAVAWFQRQQNWTGAGADGYPGEKTLELLSK